MRRTKSTLIKTIAVLLLIGQAVAVTAQALKVSKLELNYPSPGIPYYHVKADLDLPTSSMIEVDIIVNGKTLRYIDLHAEHELGDLSYPHFTNRPPSGAGLSQDNKKIPEPRFGRLGKVEARCYL